LIDLYSVLTGLFSGDYSSLGHVPQKPPNNNLWGLLQQDSYRLDAISVASQQYQSTEVKGYI